MKGNTSQLAISFAILVVMSIALGFCPGLLYTAPSTSVPQSAAKPSPQKPSFDEPRSQKQSKRAGENTADDSQGSGDGSAPRLPARGLPRPVAGGDSESFVEPASATYSPALMVGAAGVVTPDVAGSTRVLDVRSAEKYLARHIPGAVHVNLDEWVKAFTASQSSSAWEQRIGLLGINPGTAIVLCGDGSGNDAACLWAILRYWGFKDVRVLNGGWPAWLFAGASQDDVETIVSPQSIKLEPEPARVVSKAGVLELLKSGNEQILGAFSSEQPGARSQTRSESPSLKCLAWTEVIDWREYTFLSAPDLDLLFRSAAIDISRPIVVCGDSLEQVATLSFALEAIGATKVRICFSDWEG